MYTISGNGTGVIKLNIDMILGSGDFISVTRENFPDLFFATCGGMGLTGFIYSATFQLKRISSTKIIQSIKVLKSLEEIQFTLYKEAEAFREANTKKIATYEEFQEIFKDSNERAPFVVTPWAGDKALEASIKKEFGVTIRCLPLETKGERAPCLFTKEQKAPLAIFARSY